VTGIRFWSLELDSAYRGSISWSITQDGGGAPGTTLASGVESGDNIVVPPALPQPRPVSQNPASATLPAA
jgi:hypothetical protein